MSPDNEPTHLDTELANFEAGSTQLDTLLAAAAPRTGELTPEGGRILDGAIREARPAASTWGRRPARRALVAGAAAALLSAGGLAAAAALETHSDSRAWGSLTVEASEQATIIEWPIELPDGTQCIERLTAIGLTDTQLATLRSSLADPASLIAADDGAVREEFIGYLDSGDFSWSGDRDSFEATIDAGYAAVAQMDATSGRGAVSDEELTVFPGSEANEIFMHTVTRVVLDGIESNGVPSYQAITPETACKASA